MAEESRTMFQDGIKFNWDVFPSTRLEVSEMQSPLGCLYQPLSQRPKKGTKIPRFHASNMLSCSSCSSIMSPYSKIDRNNKMWWCPFCKTKTFLPQDFEILPPGSAAEQWPEYLRNNASLNEANIVEYELLQSIDDKVETSIPDAFIFVIDIYQHVDELQTNRPSFKCLIERIVDSLEKIPDGSLVAFISFDETVEFHKVAEGSSKKITEEFLSVNSTTPTKYYFNNEFQESFFNILGLESAELPYEWRKNALLKAGYFSYYRRSDRNIYREFLKSLKPKLTRTYRSIRCTGMALLLSSIVLSQGTFKNFYGNMMLFTSGPCNIGPGSVIGGEPHEHMRSHNDISQLTAPFFVNAARFYGTLSYIGNGFSFLDSFNSFYNVQFRTTDSIFDISRPRWSVDIYSGSPDQSGIYEMKSLASNTKGRIQLVEAFDSLKFQEALNRNIEMSSNKSYKLRAQLTVLTSNGLKTSKMLGHGVPLASSFQRGNVAHLHHQMISDSLGKFDSKLKKRPFTNRWYFNRMNSHDTLAVYFDVETAATIGDISLEEGEFFIQFKFSYFDPTEKKNILRVTTLRKYGSAYLLVHKYKLNLRKIKGTRLLEQRGLIEGFDQRAWIILLSRLYTDKIDTLLGFEDIGEIPKDLENTLVRLLYHFDLVDKVENVRENSNPYGHLSESVKIRREFDLLPTMVYHMKRNPQLLKIFNSSPDETAYYHHWFMVSDYDTSCNMIMPSLYCLHETAEISELKVSSLKQAKSGSFFVLDSIFDVIIYKHFSETDQQSKIELHPSDNRNLLISDGATLGGSIEFVKLELMAKPGIRNELISRFILTQTGHSQARYFTSRLSPENALQDITQKLDRTTIDNSGSLLSYFKFLTYGLLSSDQESAKEYDISMTDDQSLEEYESRLSKLVQNFKYSGENS